MAGSGEVLRELLFEAKGIGKRFGPALALDDVNLSVYRGEITGLIGENGSGKSTISSIVAGMQRPSRGEMFFKGRRHAPATMTEGSKLGIGMIVQEMGTIPGIGVAENIFLGEEERFRRFGLISRRRMVEAAREALRSIGSDIDPEAPIDRLDMQDRKLVELAKVMYARPELLIVDETTTALSHHGREMLYLVMRRMAAEGRAVLFISHDLGELMAMCDTLTVLRDGKYVATLPKSEMSERKIKHLMVGRQMDERYYRGDFGGRMDEEVVLLVRDITTGSGLLVNFTLDLHRGEILGIGGLSHCGMHELGRALFGEERLLTGSVLHAASGMAISSPIVAMEKGIGYVSKNRDVEALVLSASVRDNIASAALDRIASPSGFISPRGEKAFVKKQIEALGIKCVSMDQCVQYLSGGNKQKVVFGKWIGRDCDILVLDCPTRGVDVGVKAAMYDLMYRMKLEGKSLVLISEELPELLGMSDRLLILKDGRLAGEFPRDEGLTETAVIETMI